MLDADALFQLVRNWDRLYRGEETPEHDLRHDRVPLVWGLAIGEERTGPAAADVEEQLTLRSKVLQQLTLRSRAGKPRL